MTHHFKRKFSSSCTGSLVGLFLLATPAAAIPCKGPYQIVQGQLIATPYCEDNYLARVAREYGIRVSNREIRQNPNKKQEVCRFMGSDIRVRQICAGYRDSGPRF
jgi:hypothetical protein